MKRRILTIALCLMVILSMLAAPVSASAASKDIVKIKTINTNARLRTGPGNYDWSKILKKGTKVIVGKKTNAFYYVKTSSGETGYIYEKYLSDYGAVSNKQVYAAVKNAKVYKKPSTSAKAIKTVKAGQYVFVYGVRGDWAYVKTMSGKGGYMKTSALVKS